MLAPSPVENGFSRKGCQAYGGYEIAGCLAIHVICRGDRLNIAEDIFSTLTAGEESDEILG